MCHHTNQNQSLVKSEIRHYFIRLTICYDVPSYACTHQYFIHYCSCHSWKLANFSSFPWIKEQNKPKNEHTQKKKKNTTKTFEQLSYFVIFSMLQGAECPSFFYYKMCRDWRPNFAQEAPNSSTALYDQLTHCRGHGLILTYKLLHCFGFRCALVALPALHYAVRCVLRWYMIQELTERENQTYKLDIRTSLWKTFLLSQEPLDQT